MRPFTAFILSLIPAVADAQTNVIRLGPPDSLAEPFTRIVALRELSDQRVLIADRREKRLAVVSFGGLPTRTIGKLGNGFGEYLAVGPLLAMDADSTAMIDASAGQWMLLKGSEPVSMASPASLLRRAAPFPFGVSPTHVYGFTLPSSGLGATAHDTMALIRVSRQTNSVDTITRLAAPSAKQTVDTAPNQKLIVKHISIPTTTMGEQATLFDDGWIALARLNPYRVDWIDPSRAVHYGKPLSASGDSTPPFTALAATLSDLSPALFKGPSGELLIRRIPTATNPEQRYDVIDRYGNLSAQIAMPPRETLIGVGAAHLYTLRTGEDGKEQLRRYAWPLRVRVR